jgi:hypothetical protein
LPTPEKRFKHAHTASQAAKAAPPATVDAPAAAKATPVTESKDEFVRQAAYFYYEARGRVGGHELDDWLRAEAEFERQSRPEAGDADAASH